VAFEAAYGWGWLIELLEDYGSGPHMVHPLRCKGDRLGAAEERQGPARRSWRSCIAVLVGAFSIYNTFSILAAQRSRESSLLQALGGSSTIRALLANDLLRRSLLSATGLSSSAVVQITRRRPPKLTAWVLQPFQALADGPWL
jgi:hypothetical protein